MLHIIFSVSITLYSISLSFAFSAQEEESSATDDNNAADNRQPAKAIIVILIFFLILGSRQLRSAHSHRPLALHLAVDCRNGNNAVSLADQLAIFDNGNFSSLTLHSGVTPSASPTT